MPSTITVPEVFSPQGFYDLEGRGFAGAIGTEETYNLPFTYFEGDIIYCLLLTIQFGKPGNFN